MGITISPWMMAFLMLMTGFAGFVDSAAGGGGLISLPAYLVCRAAAPLHLCHQQVQRRLRHYLCHGKLFKVVP